MTTKPRLFIGSASETVAIAAEIGEWLKDQQDYPVDVNLWTDTGSFKAGEHALEALERLAGENDFAVFVWGISDLTTWRGMSSGSPRDNVVYEAGLFAGSLGRDRVIVVSTEGTKIPSDYLGVTRIIFHPEVVGTEAESISRIAKRLFGSNRSTSRKSFRLASGSVEQITIPIRDRIKDLGPKPARLLSGHWWQLVSAEGPGSMLSFVEVEPEQDGRSVKMYGDAWDQRGAPLAEWWTVAAHFRHDTDLGLMLRYIWQGRHPNKGGAPLFLGEGYIGGIQKLVIDSPPLKGEFSSIKRHVAPDEDPSPKIKSTKYKRPAPEHVRTMKVGSTVEKNKLIETMLHERK